MKKNHIDIESLISQAISHCGEDYSLEKTKSYLIAALNDVRKVSKKRLKNHNNLKANEAAQKTQQQKWWEMIKKNALNNLLESMEKEVKDNEKNK